MADLMGQIEDENEDSHDSVQEVYSQNKPGETNQQIKGKQIVRYLPD
jgi:hypothetical protein